MVENSIKKIPVLLSDFLNENVIDTNKNLDGVFTGHELLSRNFENIPCLIDPIFPKVGLIGLAGSSDTGKSSLLRQLAVSVSLGSADFLGFPILSETQNAIYVSTEDGEDAISFLLHKCNKSKQLLPSDYSRLTYIFETINILEKLDTLLSQERRDLLIIDCFTDLYGKSMNDTNQVRTFLNDYSQLAQKYQCLIIFLHHTGKRTDDLAPSKHNLLGSQGFEAKMRMVVELRVDESNPDIRHFCIVKGNYLTKEYKTESYVLLFDEYLQFTNTGERRPMTNLKSKISNSNINLLPEKFDKSTHESFLYLAFAEYEKLQPRLFEENLRAVLLNNSISLSNHLLRDWKDYYFENGFLEYDGKKGAATTKYIFKKENSQ